MFDWIVTVNSTARAFGPAVFEGFENYHWIYCAYLSDRACDLP